MLFIQSGLVGLENLGATCYINTFLQVCNDTVLVLDDLYDVSLLATTLHPF